MQAEPVLRGHDGRLDRLQVAVRVVGGEHSDATTIDGPERRACVRQALTDDRGDDPREKPDPEAARQLRPVDTRSRESRADHNVRETVEDGAEDRRQLTGVVLAVAIDLDGDIEVVLVCVLVTGLDRAADAEIERKPNDVGSLVLGDLGGPVG